jgi:hypothetical protein
MAKFTIRVQLMGDPTSEEYNQLHDQMSSLGFERTVKGTTRDGAATVVSLPHGLYYGSSVDSAGTVRDRVSRAAKTIQPKIKVFVAETETWAAQ